MVNYEKEIIDCVDVDKWWENIVCVDVGKWWELITCVDVQFFGYW